MAASASVTAQTIAIEQTIAPDFVESEQEPATDVSEEELDDSEDDDDDDESQVVRLLPKTTQATIAAEPVKRISMRRSVSEKPSMTRSMLVLKPELGLPVPTLKHRSSFIDPVRHDKMDKLASMGVKVLPGPVGSIMQASELTLRDDAILNKDMTMRDDGFRSAMKVESEAGDVARLIFDWQAHGFDKGQVLNANFQAVKKDRYLMTVTLAPDVESTYRLSVSSLQREQILQELQGRPAAAPAMATA